MFLPLLPKCLKSSGNLEFSQRKLGGRGRNILILLLSEENKGQLQSYSEKHQSRVIVSLHTTIILCNTSEQGK